MKLTDTTCPKCTTGIFHNLSPLSFTNYGTTVDAVEAWCQQCNSYHIEYTHPTTGNLISDTVHHAYAENFYKIVARRIELAILAASKGKVPADITRAQGVPDAPTDNRHMTSTSSEEETTMPEIVKDFDPKVRRRGSGSGRPKVFNIDLKPLDQVAGKTQKGSDNPVFVRYSVHDPDDLDGAAHATFQQQARKYAEDMPQGDTKHGYKATIRNVPRTDNGRPDGQPVLYPEGHKNAGEQIVDFYVAVTPVTEADLRRRESYQNRGSGNGKAEDGSESQEKVAGK